MKSKHVISMGVLQKKFKLCQSRAANSIVKWYHANSRFSLNSNFLVKPFYLTRGFATFRQRYKIQIWYFLAFSMVKLKEVSFVSLSELSMSKSAKIFHFIFCISLSGSRTFSRGQKSAPVCENTIFKLSLCQISAYWKHYFCQLCSFF